MKEYILCSAIHFDDGLKHTAQPKNITSGFVVAGRRHDNCYLTAAILIGKEEPLGLPNFPVINGFITNTDRFVDRYEGFKVAVLSGQVKDDGDKVLISEDLW